MTVNNHQSAGFSLVELVTVIVLLGILSIVALGRFTGSNAVAARGYFDDIVGAVRFAQKLAISSGCDVRVVVTAGSSPVGGYQLRQSSSCAADNFSNLVDNPANRAIKYTNNKIPTGFTLSGGIITFDARGQREEATSVFTLSDGTTNYQFRVHASTGLVEV